MAQVDVRDFVRARVEGELGPGSLDPLALEAIITLSGGDHEALSYILDEAIDYAKWRAGIGEGKPTLDIVHVIKAYLKWRGMEILDVTFSLKERLEKLISDRSVDKMYDELGKLRYVTEGDFGRRVIGIVTRYLEVPPNKCIYIPDAYPNTQEFTNPDGRVLWEQADDKVVCEGLLIDIRFDRFKLCMEGEECLVFVVRAFIVDHEVLHPPMKL